MFEFVVTVQIVMTLIFFLENLETLNDIVYVFAIGTSTYTVNVNMYSLLGIIGIAFVIVILFSFNLFGSGLNEEGTRALGRYVGIVLMYLVTNIGCAYYLLRIANIGFIIELFFAIVYVLNTLNLNLEG
jgi:hypothetical protein